MDIALDEVVHFDVITSTPSTGAAVDADSAPTFDVFEEATDTPILDDQTMTKRTSLTGNYRGTFTMSAANGFEVGKWYSVVVAAAVGGVTGKCRAMHFRCCAAEAVAGKPKVDVDAFGGSAGTFSSGRPEVNATHWGGTAVASANVLIDGAITSAKFAAGAVNNAAVSFDGSELTAVPWNASWDAEVESEVNDALVAQNLDHLVKIAVDTDFATTVHVDSVVGQLAQTADGGYSRATDSLEAVRDRGDAAWTTSTLAAADVWASATRTLTAGTNINGSTFTAIPWNASWDAEVQSEVQDAIEANHLDHLLAADYDPANKPGVATALLNELVESDAGVSRYTANALEQAPAGGGGGGGATAQQVWEYATRTLTSSSDPTAAQIADAVWDESTTGHTTSGTFGEQAKTDIDAILADTSTLGGATVTVTSVTYGDGSVVTVLRGDDYHNDDGRALEWLNEDGTWPDLTGATITLYLNDNAYSFAGSVVTPTGANQKVRVEPTSAWTGSIAAGAYDYDVVATLATNLRRVTLASGAMRVTDSERS